MARITPRVDVAVKAGRNKPVKHVIKLETLVRHLREGAPAAAKKPRGLKVEARVLSAEARRLVADLEKQLKALRRAMPKPAARGIKRR
jgi:hypothetical protein